MPIIVLQVGANENGAEGVNVEEPIYFGCSSMFKTCYPTAGRGGTTEWYTAWFRFINVNIPQGAVINSAIMEIYCVSDDDPSIWINPVYVDDDVDYDSDPAICVRPVVPPLPGSIRIGWSATNIGVNAWKSIPDIKTLIQAIIDRPGWSYGNSLGIRWDSDHAENRLVTAHNYTDSKGAKLTINYSAPLTTTSTSSSTSTTTTSTSTTTTSTSTTSTSTSTTLSPTTTSTSTTSSTSTSTSTSATSTSVTSTSTSTSTTSSTSSSTSTTLGRGYRLAANWEDLKVDTVPLLTSPHPAYFTEGEVIGESESGYPIELGEASARWVYEDQILSALAWDQLIDFIDDSGFGIVYIQTRTNEITAGRFTYSRYKGFMKRPEGTSIPPWRYKEVEIEFFSLTPWSDAEERGYIWRRDFG